MGAVLVSPFVLPHPRRVPDYRLYSFFFFGGLAIHISVALLAHLFSYNITWSATIKEVERSNFFKEIPKIFKRFWFSMLVSFAIIAGMIICSTSLVPYAWRVDGTGWAVIFPLSIVCGCHILFPVSYTSFLRSWGHSDNTPRSS